MIIKFILLQSQQISSTLNIYCNVKNMEGNLPHTVFYYSNIAYLNNMLDCNIQRHI